MKTNKEIISLCRNFYKIINYEYPAEDDITNKLITIYERYIFSIDITNKKEVAKVKEIDRIYAKYIDDYFFRKNLKKEIESVKTSKEENLLKAIIDAIIRISHKFEDGVTRNIYVSRWI